MRVICRNPNQLNISEHKYIKVWKQVWIRAYGAFFVVNYLDLLKVLFGSHRTYEIQLETHGMKIYYDNLFLFICDCQKILHLEGG